MNESPDTPRRLLIRGITWTAAAQLVEVALSFGSMLVLVRIIAARDYGRAAAVTGILALLNTFGAHMFVEHALQLPEDEHPDWQLHWTFAFYLQFGVMTMAHIIAGFCWLSTEYRPIAKLLHLAAFGLLLDWPNQVSATMLRRNLDLRRLRIIASVGMALRLATTVTLALAGLGAYAIVIGSNVVTAIPFGFDLLVLRGWRPLPGWYKPPVWSRYSAQATFGMQRAGATLIGGVRSATEAAFLPAPLGFAALGLINRSQALYTTTFGRAGTVLADVIYPFLPRSSRNPERYASHATMYLRVMMLVTVPAALFISEYGPMLSRVLYGSRWAAMDPLIRPGAIVSVAVAVLGTAAAILMAAGRMRDCLFFEGLGAAGAVPALAIAWSTRLPLAYSWACAAAELVVAGAALWRAGPLLRKGWIRIGLVPPMVAAIAGLAVTQAMAQAVGTLPRLAQLSLIGAVYGLINLLVLRVAFPKALDDLLVHAPAGGHLLRVLRLRTEEPALTTALPEMGDLP
jgi:O-antigen/teichoic acid export membrane protein